MSDVEFDQLIVNATITTMSRLSHCVHFWHKL